MIIVARADFEADRTRRQDAKIELARSDGFEILGIREEREYFFEGMIQPLLRMKMVHWPNRVTLIRECRYLKSPRQWRRRPWPLPCGNPTTGFRYSIWFI